jgi:hypothetical protein
MRCLGPLILLAIGLVGCATTPTAMTSDDPFAVAPADFSIDLIVRPDPAAADPADAARRAGHYVLFPDGSLHYSETGRGTPDGLPPLVRRLNRRQVAEVWSFARQSGFADPANGGEPTNISQIAADAGQVVYLIRLTGADRRWEFIRRVAPPHASDPASAELVRLLAKLAWASEEAAPIAAAAPRRDDFGPDPYARYRK